MLLVPWLGTALIDHFNEWPVAFEFHIERVFTNGDKMAILQTAYSNSIYCMKVVVFGLDLSSFCYKECIATYQRKKYSYIHKFSNWFVFYWICHISPFSGQLLNMRGLDYKLKSMLNSMLVNKDFLTWLLTGWQLCCCSTDVNQSDARFWKSMLTINMNFKIEVSK